MGNDTTDLGWHDESKRSQDSPANIYELNCQWTLRQHGAFKVTWTVSRRHDCFALRRQVPILKARNAPRKKQGIQSKGFCQLSMAGRGLQPAFGVADKTVMDLRHWRVLVGRNVTESIQTESVLFCASVDASLLGRSRRLGTLQSYATDQTLRCVKAMEDTSLFGYLDELFGYAMVLARNPTEAADLVQETFVRALKAKESLRYGSNVKSWMFTILRNIWLNQLRHKRRAPQVVELEAYQSTADTAIKTSKDPYAQYVSEMEQKEVRNAIQQLPAQFREIIILREYEELSYQEIAALLECPAGTVMSRLSRARSRLRVLLSENEQSFQQNESRKFKGSSPEL
jgi:RNA polymerase sigma-70 factor, ECF subfamily